MGDDEGVEPPDPFLPEKGGDDRFADVEPVGFVAAAVDEHGPAVRQFDEGGRSLAHVEQGGPQRFPFPGAGPERAGERAGEENEQGKRRHSVTAGGPGTKEQGEHREEQDYLQRVRGDRPHRRPGQGSGQLGQPERQPQAAVAEVEKKHRHPRGHADKGDGEQAAGQGPQAEQGFDHQVGQRPDEGEPVEVVEHEGQGAQGGGHRDEQQGLDQGERPARPAVLPVRGKGRQMRVDEVDGEHRGKAELKRGGEQGER